MTALVALMQSRIRRAEAFAALYRDGQTLEQIGLVHGISRERVRQLLASIGVGRSEGGIHVRAQQVRAERRLRIRDNCMRRWGITKEQYDDIRATHGYWPFKAYTHQRKNANSRSIGWEFTFGSWWERWQQSGKWHLRGRGQGYCMGRLGDVGPYSPSNVYICTIGQNFSDSYNIDHPRRKRARRLPVRAHKYKVKTGERWMVELPAPINDKRYYGGFNSKDEAEQHGLALLRAA